MSFNMAAFFSIIPPQRLDGIKLRGFAGWIQAGDHSAEHERAERERGGPGNEAGRIPAGHFSGQQRLQHAHECSGCSDADDYAYAGEQQALPEKLREDAALRCAQRLAEADLRRAFAYRDEHDVDDADGAKAERNNADASEEDIHGREDGADHLHLLDGVPFLERVGERRIETVARSNYAMYGGDGCGGIALLCGLVLDGRERVAGNVFALEREELLHGGDGDVQLLIVAVVVAARDLLDGADDVEGCAVDGDGFAEPGASGKEQVGGFRTENGDAPAVGEIGCIEEAPLRHGNEAHLRVVWTDADYVAGGIRPLADFVEVGAAELDRDGADFGELPDGFGVAERELVRTQARVLVGDGGDRPVPHQNEVVAEAREVAALAGAKTFAETDED